MLDRKNFQAWIDSLQNFEAVLPKVTSEDEVARREKECDLSHVFEDIWLLLIGPDMMGTMNSDEQFTLYQKRIRGL
jgi:hypothetical protein